MATVNIDYNCGCGFRARTVEEAIGHADTSHHTLTVAGSVRSSEPKVREVKAPLYASANSHSRAMKLTSVAAHEEDAGFSNLRAKLQRKLGE